MAGRGARLVRLFSRFLLLALFFYSSATASPYLGVSSYSALSPKFPCKTFIRYSKLSPKPAMAVLAGTFGNDWRCVQTFLDTFKDRPHLLEIHLSNEACRRDRRCGPGELFQGMGVASYNRSLEGKNSLVFSTISSRISRISSSFTPNGSSKVLLSTGLEDNYSLLAAQNIYDLVKEKWSYEVVRNPVKAISYPDYVERHRVFSTNCTSSTIINNDGSEVSLPYRYRQQNSKCGAIYIWTAKLQGIYSAKFVWPRARHFSVSVRDDSLIRNFFKG